ncbi:MAG: hypothetical protein QOE70_3912 [Chthoniobacter sp.]|jgi:hypothetical protein|nr:hypothetical protein [Chthoniobacter sp.]
MNQGIAQTNSSEDMSNQAQPRATPHFATFSRPFLAYVTFLCLCIGAPADEPKSNPDFSNYDVPLYDQITNHIKAKVTARLGEGKNKQDRYFIIPFAYENKGNAPELSHTFISVIRVLADDKQTKLTSGLQKKTYQNRNFEAFTISWLPHDFAENPHLCVFNGFGSRLFPDRNTCPTSVGRVFKLDETIRLGVNAKNAVCMWGPYEIRQDAFDLAVKRLRLLEGGTIKYRADDRITRKDRSAINCFHATANLYELYPNGGIFGTGFKMWGVNGTARVLIEYTKKASNKGLLLEPVDVKADRYGFVYAPTRTSRGIYNPFQKAFAYQR